MKKQPPPEKPLTILKKSRFDKGPDHDVMRTVFAKAIGCTVQGVQWWLIFGQMLLEKKAALDHGEWEEYRNEKWPELSDRKARRLMQCVLNIQEELSPPALNIPLSAILLWDDKDVAGAALTYKREWFAWTDGRNFQDYLGGYKSFENAVTGKVAGGHPDDKPDRKDYGVHAFKKFKHLTSFLTIRKNGKPYRFRDLPQFQRDQFTAAFTGSLEKWPRWMLEAGAEKIKLELKREDVDRLARYHED